MQIIVSVKSQEPLYEQIKKQIIHSIITKKISNDFHLPSIRVLAKELQVGIITVKRAYDDLVKEGYLVSKEAKGYYVNEISQTKIQADIIKKFKEKLKTIIEESKKYNIRKEDLKKIWEETIYEWDVGNC